MLKVVQEAPEPNVAGSVLDEIVSDGARQMLAAALQAEVAAYIDSVGIRGRGRHGLCGHRSLLVRPGSAATATRLVDVGDADVLHATAATGARLDPQQDTPWRELLRCPGPPAGRCIRAERNKGSPWRTGYYWV